MCGRFECMKAGDTSDGLGIKGRIILKWNLHAKHLNGNLD
jgi:hypothetical protein